MNGIKYPNLRAEMARAGMTICSLSGALGMDRNRLSRKLSGRTSLSLEEAISIRDAICSRMLVEELFDIS